MKLNPSTNLVSRNQSIVALLLIVPMSSIGAIFSTFLAPGAIGQRIAIGCGIWMLIFPILWHRFIDSPTERLCQGQQLRLRLSKHDGLLVGIMLGIIMFGLIFGGYWFGGRYWLNTPDIRARASQMGMNIPLMIFGFGTFQTLVNSLIEEYVWRWFVYRHCQLIWSKTWAIFISAGFFTIHHIILMTAYCDNWLLVLVGSISIFIAGVLWAICTKMYKSLLPSYISHLAADLALQIVSWQILLG
jgi:uncharacterized protein